MLSATPEAGGQGTWQGGHCEVPEASVPTPQLVGKFRPAEQQCFLRTGVEMVITSSQPSEVGAVIFSCTTRLEGSGAVFVTQKWAALSRSPCSHPSSPPHRLMLQRAEPHLPETGVHQISHVCPCVHTCVCIMMGCLLKNPQVIYSSSSP